MAKLKKKEPKTQPAKKPEPTSPPANISERDAFVMCANSEIGSRYKWATAGPDTFDCSGLVAYCYKRATGKDITRSSYDQIKLGKSVNIDNLQPGDLVFWDTENNGTAGHVGIYRGNREVVNAMNASTGVKVSPLTGSYGGPFLGARRLDFAGDASQPTQPTQPAAKKDVTRQTNFREAGNTTRAAFREALSRTITNHKNTALIAEADTIYDALEPLGLTRLAAGMAWIERSNDTNPDGWREFYGTDLHNLWAVKGSVAGQRGEWGKWPSYTEAAKFWGPYVLGNTYKDLTSIAQFIGRYAPWSDGNDTDQYGNKLVAQINSLPFQDSPAQPGPTPPPQPQPGYKEWTIPGLGKIKLPDYITVEIDLTPVGVHRPGRVVTMTGSTWHETGNRGNGSGARMHSNWQDGCTQGHPDGYVGVTAYVENRLILVKIPLNENSIHSGDWRNNAHPSMEVCVNADRNAEQTEDTAMWWQAALLLARSQNAVDHLYPHHSSGCPALRNAAHKWPEAERGVDQRITTLKQGGTIPTPPTYAEAIPIPKDPWDGTDYVAPNGERFYALQRVFVTERETAARKYASKSAPEVRKKLPRGEAFLSHYMVQGEGGMWLVSQYGSRILAADCLPRLGLLVNGSWMGDSPSVWSEPILNDPSGGLSAEKDVDDTPISKQEFMAHES